MDEKRLFFGFEVGAPWPESYPEGRIVDEKVRHMTLAFLGQADFSFLEPQLKNLPLPKERWGAIGLFTKVLFLPPHHPRVVAWQAQFFKGERGLNRYQRELTQWLMAQGFSLSNSDRSWLPHSTLARQPFHSKNWLDEFEPTPFVLTSICLYESLGHLHYEVLWRHPFHLPFEEIEHTADVAFKVRGTTWKELFSHAQQALCFISPPLLPFGKMEVDVESLEDIVRELNYLIARADVVKGASIKAVSYHGEATKTEGGYFEWEMIVDV